jgi:hypothetical protein
MITELLGRAPSHSGNRSLFVRQTGRVFWKQVSPRSIKLDLQQDVWIVNSPL